MKSEKVKQQVLAILKDDSSLFDGVCAKDIKKILTENYGMKTSEKTIIKVMQEILASSESLDGFLLDDGTTLTWDDENDNGDSQLRGLHKYWWFII